MKTDLLEEIRNGSHLTTAEEIRLIAVLSLPGIFAQISTVVMEYADQAMVGRLGAGSSAAIGLVASTTWLMGGLCRAANTGYTVQLAHKIGAKKDVDARRIMRQGLLASLAFSLVLAVLGAFISARLPLWLGGNGGIQEEAAAYFMIFSLALPFLQLSSTGAGMLQCSGNMRVPSLLNIMGCGLNVVFNYLLIFPSREVSFAGREMFVPGVGLGVAGAALGTALSQAFTAILMLYFLLFRSQGLKLRWGERAKFSIPELKTAVRIAIPIGVEQVIIGCGYVISTRIVSPLGNVSLAANSFAVTAESLCYMPGYGIAAAATTLIGQSLGAGQKKEARRLGFLTTGAGILVMTGTGILMYLFAPHLMAFLSPDSDIQALGALVLRIEAFAEPMFAASIVAAGVFRGAGDTFVPFLINFASMWAVRLTLAALLAPVLGLKGVWIAMCLDLNVRGILFLIRLCVRPIGSSRKQKKMQTIR